MKHLLVGIAMTMAVVNPVWGQAASPRQPPAPYGYYRAVAPTPEDAYRDGLITRWELEQLQGPTPQALQGPSPNGRSEGFNR